MAMNIDYLLGSPIMEDITGALEMIALGKADLTDWSEIARAVRNGMGAKMFPIGTQFTTPHTTYGNIV